MSLTITDKAAERVKQYGGTMRVGIAVNGCSGKSYQVTAMPDLNDDDHIFENNGVTLVVSQKDLLYIDGTNIDYSPDLLSSGFTFNNPNAKNCCGCGESFDI